MPSDENDTSVRGIEQEAPSTHECPGPLNDQPSTADIVRAFEVGDYAAFQMPSVEGEIKWTGAFVDDAGEDFVTFGGYHLEVVDDEGLARYCYGDEAVRATIPGRKRESMASANGIERIPEARLQAHDWYRWEVGVSETRGMEAVSTDQTLIVEAPTREVAVETAKRRAGMSSGYERVSYQLDPLGDSDE